VEDQLTCGARYVSGRQPVALPGADGDVSVRARPLYKPYLTLRLSCPTNK